MTILIGAGLACNLPGVSSTAPAEAEMTLDEALQVAPEDARPEVLRLMGQPDSFTLEWQDLNGQRVRWEEWSYFDQGTRFDFLDGELVWTIDIEPAPDGSLFAHFYDPLEFDDGLSLDDVTALLGDQELEQVALDEADIPGGQLLIGDQILLGFDAGKLVSVQTLVLAPAAEVAPAAQSTGGPTLPPATLAPTAQSDLLLGDDFETVGSAMPLFGPEAMAFAYDDGAGVLTARSAGVLPVMYAAPILSDFVAEVDIRSPAARPGSGYGLVFRSDDPAGGLAHYYHVLLWPADGRVSLDAWKDGAWVLTEGGPLPQDLATTAGPNRLRLEAQGSEFRVLVNGSLVLEVQDTQIPGPGVIGLSVSTTNYPETVSFDDLEVSAP